MNQKKSFPTSDHIMQSWKSFDQIILIAQKVLRVSELEYVDREIIQEEDYCSSEPYKSDNSFRS